MCTHSLDLYIHIAMAKALYRRKINNLPLPKNQAEATTMLQDEGAALGYKQKTRRGGRRRKP